MNASLRPARCTSLQLLQGQFAPAPHLRVTHSGVRTGAEERTKPTCMGVVAATSVEGHGPSAVAVMDIEAYNRVVDDHSDALYRYVVKQLRDRDEAKDIVQECFLRLWMRLDQVTVIGARRYLFTIAHNLVVDRSRRRKRLERYGPVHEQMLTTEQPKAGLEHVIDRALAQLPPLQRSLILLRDRDGHSYQDVANITGLDMTKVKVYLFRARRAVQGHLGELSALV
jgi:RNA polymerase sigma-70 factor (ECF subfamily)